jgi:pimeloyl-ACP methyl ester carboxylesterase
VHDGLAVYRFGDGPPVLFMPGPHRYQRPGTASGDALIQGLVGLGRRVVTFDPPGSGRSPRPARLGMAEMHACACEALAVAGVGGAVDALGHSMGGLALLGFALEHPDLVGRLVLVGTGTGGRAYLSAEGALWHRGHPGFARMAALGTVHIAVRRRATERLLNNEIRRWSLVDRSLARPEPVRPRDWLSRAEGFAEWHRVARRIDYGPRLDEITAPTLVLCGRHDCQFPPSCTDELSRGVAGARVHWFERSGHYPFVEEPHEFWPIVGDFLTGPTHRAPGTKDPGADDPAADRT